MRSSARINEPTGSAAVAASTRGFSGAGAAGGGVAAGGAAAATGAGSASGAS